MTVLCFNFRFDVINYGTREIVQGMARNRIWQFKRVSRNRIAYEILGRFKDAVEEDDEKVLRDFLMVCCLETVQPPLNSRNINDLSSF